MIRLIITDLDGTFLDAQGDFDRTAYDEVKRIMDKHGTTFAICTGKQCERVEELFGPQRSADIWIVGDSATRIKRGGKELYQALLPNAIGLALIDRLQSLALDHVIIACTKKGAYVSEDTPNQAWEIVRKSYATLSRVKDFHTLTEDWVKITVFDLQQRCFETVKALDDFQSQAYIVASEAAWIDITKAGVHKGSTIAHLQHMLGVTHEETMAFGDGLNDIELLQSATYSFAVANAFDATKQAAQFITKSNAEQGVLQTIQLILALDKGDAS